MSARLAALSRPGERLPAFELAFAFVLAFVALSGLAGCASSSAGPRAPSRASAAGDSGGRAGADGRLAEPSPRAEDLGTPLPELELPVEQSRVGVTLRVTRAALEAQLARALPQELVRDWQRVTPKGKSPEVETRYVVRRGPLQLRTRGQTLQISLPITYHGELRGRLRVPLIGRWVPLKGDLQWGTAAKPQTLTLRAEVQLGVKPDYSLQVRAKVQPPVHGPAPAGQLCVKAGIRLCVDRGSLAPEVRRQIDFAVVPGLERGLGDLLARLQKSLDTQAKVPELWASIACPWSIRSGKPVCKPPAAADDDLWLRFAPSKAGVGRPRWVGASQAPSGKAGKAGKARKYDGALELDLSLTGPTTLVAGAWPGADAEGAGAHLPALGTEAPEGFELRTHAQLPYSVLAKAIEGELRAEAFPVGELGELEIAGVSLAGRAHPESGPMLLLELRLGGALDGTIHLWGSPRYDAASRVLRLEGLDYTFDSRDRLARGLESLNHAEFRERLARRAVIDLAPALDRLRAGIEAELSRDLDADLRSSGQLELLEPGTPRLSRDRVLWPLHLRGEIVVEPRW